MAKLVLSIQGKRIGEYPLNKERISIGRLKENDIHLENLAVSGRHALVLTILEDSFLEDLESTNGTYVNGKPIKKHALRNGDVIGIGKHEFRYLNDQATADEQLERTVVIRDRIVPRPPAQSTPQAPVGATAQVIPAPTAKPQAMPLARVQVLNGPGAGRELELVKSLTSLGKPKVQVAAISRRAQGYYLVHVESSGPERPLVNGVALGPQAQLLRDGDTIEIAGTKMGFFMIHE